VREVEQEQQRERMEAEATEARLKALRDTISSTVITTISG